MISKLAKVVALTLLAYLLQTTAAIHMSLWDVAPNLALVLVAVVTVGLGRKYTFFMSLTIGYLLEIMLPVLDYISLILYPVCAMLGALAFSDKSERRLEEERSTGKRSITLHAHIRTPLCAALSVTVFEAVNLFYISLNGVAINGGHIGRALIDVIYSTVLSGLLQFPLRWWLGVYKLKKAR
ncbi:MAG: hypothetical protein GXY67_08875 [Clostridiales bacterium]|nr:hypothetical protein [Clostridiales bacterium]